jgi:hypothetical protein
VRRRPPPTLTHVAHARGRFWYTKLHALTAARDLDALDAFAKAKKSPIGYAPFVHHLVAQGLAREAAAFVPRCEPAARADLYVACGDWRAAGRECKDRGDRARLECVPSSTATVLSAADERAQGAPADVPEHADCARAGSDSCFNETMIPWPPILSTALPRGF